MNKIESGSILISDPFLKDPNFLRSVVLICEHHKDGTSGFILNKKINKNISEFIPEIEHVYFPVFYGGPVQLDALHFIHTKPNIVEGGINVFEDVYWGGDFNQALEAIKQGTITPRDLRFYIGYSGWSLGQLDAEVDQKGWILYKANKSYLFHHNVEILWKEVLDEMGGEYKLIKNYPLDPQLN